MAGVPPRKPAHGQGRDCASRWAAARGARLVRPDGDDVIFTTWHRTVKARALQRDLRISLCVDDERPPFSFVMIEGTARLSDNLVEVRAWVTRIAGRYMGVMRAKAYGTRNGVPGELLVRVTRHTW